MENHTNSRRHPARAIRQFSLVWTKPPNNETLIRVGARVLRGYLERQKAARTNER